VRAIIGRNSATSRDQRHTLISKSTRRAALGRSIVPGKLAAWRLQLVNRPPTNTVDPVGVSRDRPIPGRDFQTPRKRAILKIVGQTIQSLAKASHHRLPAHLSKMRKTYGALLNGALLLQAIASPMYLRSETLLHVILLGSASPIGLSLTEAWK